jgi:hypothetical protein
MSRRENTADLDLEPADPDPDRRVKPDARTAASTTRLAYVGPSHGAHTQCLLYRS